MIELIEFTCLLSPKIKSILFSSCRLLLLLLKPVNYHQYIVFYHSVASSETGGRNITYLTQQHIEHSLEPLEKIKYLKYLRKTGGGE